MRNATMPTAMITVFLSQLKKVDCCRTDRKFSTVGFFGRIFRSCVNTSVGPFKDVENIHRTGNMVKTTAIRMMMCLTALLVAIMNPSFSEVKYESGDDDKQQEGDQRCGTGQTCVEELESKLVYKVDQVGRSIVWSALG